MARKEKLNLLRDLLEHMGTCCDAWQAADDQAETLFANSLRRDLAALARRAAGGTGCGSTVRAAWTLRNSRSAAKNARSSLYRQEPKLKRRLLAAVNAD